MIKKHILYYLFLISLLSCNDSDTRIGITSKNLHNEKDEYFSGVTNRFKKSYINKEGLFYDDFNKLPEHKSPQKHKGHENLVRYSYHSIVEKEGWSEPKNNSLELLNEGKINFIKLNLSPNQKHKKIKGYRCELTIHNGNPNLEEEWYEWRFMIPENYKIDPQNKGKEVSIVQYHYVEPKGEKRVLKGPTINFTYLEQYGKNMLLLRYGIKGQERSKYKGFDWKVIALNDEIQKGKWYTIRVNIKWSITNQGYIAAWLNGKPYTPFNGVNNKVFGSNLYNDIENTFKFGYYRYWDNSQSTAIYFDYIIKTRTFKDLTGLKPEVNELYGVKDDYRYLNEKDLVLRKKRERK